MMTRQMVLLACICVSLAGCGGPKSARGFSLPDGDKTRGQELFVELSCHECHSISGVELPALDDPAETIVRLGGEVTRIKTYGELVTSIINPSHKLAVGYQRDQIADERESKMTNYNDVMTVDQLIDLVALLQSRYTLKPFEPTIYPLY